METFLHNGVEVKVWSKLDSVEPAAIQQLRNIAKLPFIYKHIAVMPDVHLGNGATVGSVIAGKGAVSPSAVGVDIGCGMLAVPLNRTVDSLGDLKKLRAEIERAIPLGHKGYEQPQSLGGLRETASERVKSVWQKAPYQLGTLGKGNHFQELCDDGRGNAWLMLHSGSRNVGKSVADIHIKKAKDLMKIMRIQLDDPDLAYLLEETPEFGEYLADLHWCQKYARLNRERMLRRIWTVLKQPPLNPRTVINCHHNYLATEFHYGEKVLITRKGAVRAGLGEMGIIPGSMGQKSYIVRGKGNPESYCSCSHGAGRRFSRNEAKRRFTVEDLEKQTDGVECRKDSGVLDEIPGAYKDLDEVMENQSDLVEVVQVLKAVLCVKGD